MLNKIKLTKKHTTIIFCSLWFIIILFMVVSNEMIIRSGKEVLLKTVPVDPRDFMRGDYVILNYDISTPKAILNEKISKRLKYRQKVYISLDVDENGIAHAKSMSIEKPKNKEYFIRGEVLNYKNSIEYGIETYFVKENTGKEIEKNIQEGMLAKVKIDKNGKAKIVDLIKISK